MTLAEIRPWVDWREREVLFREAVIRAIVGETKEQTKNRQVSEFCKACRAAKRDTNCATCSRNVTVRRDKKEKP